jgi:hypothetical protein
MVLSADEMEKLIKSVELGQIELEHKLNLLRSKNKDLLKTLKIPFPLLEVKGEQANNSDLGKNKMLPL